MKYEENIHYNSYIYLKYKDLTCEEMSEKFYIFGVEKGRYTFAKKSDHWSKRALVWIKWFFLTLNTDKKALCSLNDKVVEYLQSSKMAKLQERIKPFQKINGNEAQPAGNSTSRSGQKVEENRARSFRCCSNTANSAKRQPAGLSPPTPQGAPQAKVPPPPPGPTPNLSSASSNQQVNRANKLMHSTARIDGNNNSQSPGVTVASLERRRNNLKSASERGPHEKKSGESGLLNTLKSAFDKKRIAIEGSDDSTDSDDDWSD